MKVTDVTTTTVFIPFEAVTRWHWGTREGADRLIIQVITDEGIVGLGETGADSQSSVKNQLKPLLVGQDPYDIEKILGRFQLFSGGDINAIAGVETALWDLMGKSVHRPVCKLLGGMYRDKMPISAWVHFRYPGKNGLGGEHKPDDMARLAVTLRKKYGFETLKLKLGVLTPKVEVEAVNEVRRTVGDDIKLRIDPNGAWTLTTAMQVMKAVDDLNLEYVEDPISIFDLEGMARLRSVFRTPLCANGSVRTPYDLVRVIRANAADVVLADPHDQGGMWTTKKIAAIAEAFNIGLSMHCSEYCGLTMAAHMHFYASTPHSRYAVDSHYHYLVDDIIKGGKIEVREGAMKLPEKPGLGVELDQSKVDKYHKLYDEVWAPFYEQTSNIPTRRHPDTKMPEFIPRYSQW